jgi:hypothetical protein
MNTHMALTRPTPVFAAGLGALVAAVDGAIFVSWPTRKPAASEAPTGIAAPAILFNP